MSYVIPSVYSLIFTRSANSFPLLSYSPFNFLISYRNILLC